MIIFIIMYCIAPLYTNYLRAGEQKSITKVPCIFADGNTVDFTTDVAKYIPVLNDCFDCMNTEGQQSIHKDKNEENIQRLPLLIDSAHWETIKPFILQYIQYEKFKNAEDIDCLAKYIEYDDATKQWPMSSVGWRFPGMYGQYSQEDFYYDFKTELNISEGVDYDFSQGYYASKKDAEGGLLLYVKEHYLEALKSRSLFDFYHDIQIHDFATCLQIANISGYLQMHSLYNIALIKMRELLEQKENLSYFLSIQDNIQPHIVSDLSIALCALECRALHHRLWNIPKEKRTTSQWQLLRGAAKFFSVEQISSILTKDSIEYTDCIIYTITNDKRMVPVKMYTHKEDFIPYGLEPAPRDFSPPELEWFNGQVKYTFSEALFLRYVEAQWQKNTQAPVCVCKKHDVQLFKIYQSLAQQSWAQKVKINSKCSGCPPQKKFINQKDIFGFEPCDETARKPPSFVQKILSLHSILYLLCLTPSFYIVSSNNLEGDNGFLYWNFISIALNCAVVCNYFYTS